MLFSDHHSYLSDGSQTVAYDSKLCNGAILRGGGRGRGRCVMDSNMSMIFGDPAPAEASPLTDGSVRATLGSLSHRIGL